ncbi:hypothetical protein OC842_000102 [Tilletia horrida]|uniref:CCHC-type domain-containing protein n=1 Tax=Tilletia horrida TaxID=155126 RepID=A0AAN6GHI0_9BASI|nr:hypothetical protein OC842_000102 [Tilletia horrida]
MTRYTKLEGRKPTATRATASLFDEVHASAAAGAAELKQHELAGADDTACKPSSKRRKLSKEGKPDAGADADADANRTAAAAAPQSEPKAPLTKEGKLKRIKLLKLKAKKSKSDDKRRGLMREVHKLENEVSAEGGAVVGAYKGRKPVEDWNAGPMSSAGRYSYGAASDGAKVETNPWKIMEAERRAKSGARTDARREKRISERQAALTCFACRGSGHSARECPNALNAHTTALNDGEDSTAGRTTTTKGKDVVGICFRCGSSAHILSRCPVKRKRRTDDEEDGADDSLPFATCFVCSQTGHLASACPQNAERGVFPMGGGACGICKSVRHRARDCPQRLEEAEEEQDGRGAILAGLEGEEEHPGSAPAVLSRRPQARAKGKATAAAAVPAPQRKKVVNF